MFLLRRWAVSLALMAVTLQTLLPATLVGALAASSPLGSVMICRTDMGDPSGPAQAPTTGHGHACPICSAPASDHIVLPTPDPPPPATRVVVVFRWRDPALSPAPRAPPTAWPDSRAPPAFS